MKLEFSRQISGKLPVLDLMHICPLRAELFHADKHESVIFRLFANAPKNGSIVTTGRCELGLRQLHKRCVHQSYIRVWNVRRNSVTTS
jgi:hypothetical protein